MKRLTRKNMQLFGTKGITLIALIITIIIMLILSGVTIALLTGDNGILSKANLAKQRTELANAEEKLKLAIAGSYNRKGDIENDLLKSNLDSTEGIQTIKSNTGNIITEQIQDEDYPLTVIIDNYEFTVEKEGIVISKNTIDDSDNNDNTSSDVTELSNRVTELENKLQTLENNYNMQNTTLTNLNQSFTELANEISPDHYIKPASITDGAKLSLGGYVKIGKIVVINMACSVDTSKLSLSTNPNSGYNTNIMKGFPKPVSTAYLTSSYWCSGIGRVMMYSTIDSSGNLNIAQSARDQYTSGYGMMIEGVYITSEE